ncbi:sugar-binding transcriptional regulator [Acerihabitans sp. TG2]|uniref:sugar-binding transcriptional regulator n=1 Tax=Acerihabitans sp. TG2 TaxID=3096008 RepID=UPI002B22E1BD|nr:sugar-binding transcriptional regulator [Acerihabitans sp. TG2]MEA9391630.1 sugar-binding transcriptional regulator [Acerihabitans sp. TG2]
MDNDIELPPFTLTRQIYRVLVMYYLDGKKQSDIAEITHLSVATVNRMIRQGRDSGMVEITIKSPFLSAHQLERDLAMVGGLQEVIVAPNITGGDEGDLQVVGAAAAEFLLSRIKDGDVITLTGGKGVSAMVDALSTARKFRVDVVPALGCVQGKHYTDVNHVASELAAKLGGRAYQIHAPLFADTPEQRQMLMDMSQVHHILQQARDASIAIVGLGSIHSSNSSYYDLNPSVLHASASVESSGARSELLAHLLDEQGRPACFTDNQRLVSLTLEELRKIPFSFAVAAGSHKVEPASSVLRGRYLKGIVTDESTAAGIIEYSQTLNGQQETPVC